MPPASTSCERQALFFALAILIARFTRPNALRRQPTFHHSGCSSVQRKYLQMSFKSLARSIELRQPDGRPASFWANRDLLPVPPEERKWTAINYLTFWIADAFNVK